MYFDNTIEVNIMKNKKQMCTRYFQSDECEKCVLNGQCQIFNTESELGKIRTGLFLLGSVLNAIKKEQEDRRNKSTVLNLFDFPHVVILR